MNSVQVLKALERERKLLEDFICLSEEQLLLLEDENIEAVNSLLQRRADLMMELTAIEATLGTWISQIRTDPSVTAEMMHELRSVNDEIVSMANHIVEIDDQTHVRLDMIKKKAGRDMQDAGRGRRAVHAYAPIPVTLDTQRHKEGPHR
jgi:DNA repair ATPase RecN